MVSTFQPTDKHVELRARIGKTSLVLIFGLLGPLAFYAPKGMWIPILLLLLVRLKIPTSIAPQDYRRIIVRNALYLVLPAYAILSAVWALVPENAVITGAKLLGYFITAMAVIVVVDRMSDAEKRSILIWAAVGFVIAALIVWVDLATAGAISGLFSQAPYTANLYSRGAAISACAVLPIAFGLFRLSGSRLAYVFAGISVATVFILQNEAAKLAAVLGILTFVAVRWRNVLFWPVILLPLAAGTMFPMSFANGLDNAMLCSLYNSKPSAAHRLIIYEFSSRNIFEKPILGWGMDASRSIPGGGGVVEISNCRYKEGLSTTQKIDGRIPLHPHNASLQVWLELGAVGVVIFLGLLGTLISRCQRDFASGDGRALTAGLFTAIFLVYNISFGLWQSWLIFALILLGALFRALRAGEQNTNDTPIE